MITEASLCPQKSSSAEIRASNGSHGSGHSALRATLKCDCTPRAHDRAVTRVNPSKSTQSIIGATQKRQSLMS